MQGDSFLDSAAYEIDKDADAHGGFGNKEAGKLAEGASREDVSGVMPLYLFKEHWEVAKKRSPPIYGFMCTLDVMGYAPAQSFVVPFMVLIKAIQQATHEPTEAN